jgi:hypothetical protein
MRLGGVPGGNKTQGGRDSSHTDFEVATRDLTRKAVTTQREVQNAFKSLFANTDNTNDLKNLYVNRLLQLILQPLDRL